MDCLLIEYRGVRTTALCYRQPLLHTACAFNPALHCAAIPTSRSSRRARVTIAVRAHSSFEDASAVPLAPEATQLRQPLSRKANTREKSASGGSVDLGLARRL